jgi:hypothetical protein
MSLQGVAKTRNMYRRAQIIRALWSAWFKGRTGTLGASPTGAPHKTFERRVRNLLERGIGLPAVANIYLPKDAAELALAIALADITMPESEITAFIHSYRADLRAFMSAAAAVDLGLLVIRPQPVEQPEDIFRRYPEIGAGRAEFARPLFLTDQAQWAALGKNFGAGLIVDLAALVKNLRFALEELEQE